MIPSSSGYHRPDVGKQAFARTNLNTVLQRVELLRELLPGVASLAEICCGDCSRQWQLYTEKLGLQRFRCLDLDPDIVALNRSRGIDCVHGDALDRTVLRGLLDFDVLFFGPPLSVACDRHRSLGFPEVTPGYADFAELLLGELRFNGTLVCICPKTTSMGDIQQLDHRVRGFRGDVGLRLIHHSYSSLTGAGEPTEVRLKYVELWFSSQLEDRWEVRESRP